MYPELAAESMLRIPCVVRCLSLLASVVILSGCGAKTLSGGEEEAPVVEAAKDEVLLFNQQTPGTGYLPADDGVPLSPEEKEALASTGDFDRDLSAAEMRDVELHFKSLVHDGRLTVTRSIERARAFMPYILKVLREENLPLDLAYLAFVESNYNPLARSGSGALGMWQFIAGTGKYCGLRQDWWVDERRDPYVSTRAATAYLTELNGLFQDWHLAISAYNAGPGKIGRGLAATGAKSFFELRDRNDRIADPKDKMSEENKQYLPKFLAVCKIMRNLGLLGFPLLEVSESSAAVAVSAKPGTDLMALCKSLGMDWETFFSHNAGFKRRITPPGSFTNVYVPPHLALETETLLKKAPVRSYEGWKPYTVKRGDTMPRIAKRTGVAVAELRRVNQVSEPLRSGETLMIPGTKRAVNGRASSPARSSSRASATAKASHVVRAGETLYSIARSYNLRHEDVMAVNNLSCPDIRPGQRLVLPAGSDSASKDSTHDQARARRTVTYKVQSGDTLWAIARKFNVSPRELLALNNMDHSVTLRPGDTVRVTRNK